MSDSTTFIGSPGSHRRTVFWQACCQFAPLIGLVGAMIASTSQAAIIFTPFGSNGEGGTTNGQVLSFGSGGEVFQLDAFVNINGDDLNGPTIGTSAQLSVNSLPSGLSYTFSTLVSADGTDLALRYEFTNNTGGTLSGVSFFSFVDAEIDVAINDYFNEAGFQIGTPGAGPGDADVDSWEIDEPGYVFGDIFSNLLSGALDNTNAVPNTSPDDVSLAIGFALGDLQPGRIATIEILLSEDGDFSGSLALQHFDTDPASFDTLTLSGTATVLVPEPSAWSLLSALGLCLIGTRIARRCRSHRDCC